MALLEVHGLSKSFGGLSVLRDVSFNVDTGEIVGVIGPNGAGKTTLFNLLTGVYRPTAGTIRFAEREVAGLRPHDICRLGLARTFQIVRPFVGLTVAQNVEVAAIYGRSTTITTQELARVMEERLDFVGLGSKASEPASSLTLAEMKHLEVARALATDPKLILLDETFSGLTPVESERSMALIRRIRDEMGITVLWIEHVMKALMRVAERVLVLDAGARIAEGPPGEIARNPQVIEAYLGVKPV